MIRSVSILVLALFFLSGAAGLGYQIVWARAFALGLGHEIASVLAVASAIFAGLSLGSGLLDRRISQSADPAAWYAALEVLIGLWALATLALIPAAETLSASWIGLEHGATGRHWSVAFGVPLVLLLPATVAMGATLPAIERWAFAVSPGRHVGALYAANNLGAVVGTLGAAYVVLPFLGFRSAILTFAAINLFCGATAWVLRRTARHAPATATGSGSAAAPRPRDAETRDGARRLPFFWFATGFLGIAYESLGVRILSRIFENSIYSFAVVLSLYLAGTALGAAAYQRWARSERTEPLLRRLLSGLAASCALGGLALYHEVALYRWGRFALGDAPAAVAASEALVAALVFLLPTLLMGATFSHLVQGARGEQGGVGHAVAVNTLGSAVAPPVVGVLALPMLGAPLLLGTLVAGYLLLARRWLFVVLALPLVLLRPLSLPSELVREGESMIAWREGVMASVAVVDTVEGARRLRVNGRFQMGGSDHGQLTRREALIPLLLHPAPREAAFLGVASGGTLRAALHFPKLQVTGVELLPEVVEVLPFFEDTGRLVAESARVSIVVADARRFARSSTDRFDVIVADFFHPGRDGAGTLYTLEHFEAIRARLDDDGLFCQWLPTYQLDEASLRSIVATFQAAFPSAWAFLGDYGVNRPGIGLVGRRSGALEIPIGFPGRASRDLPPRAVLEQNGLKTEVSLVGAALASPEQLRLYAGEAAIMRDDLPSVVYRAPHFAAQRDSVSYGRLLSMLDRVGPADLDALIAPATPARDAALARATRYVAARDAYLRGLVIAAEGDDRAAFQALWRSHDRSADFEEVRAHLERLASELEARSPPYARAIRDRLRSPMPPAR
ncbi:MAG: spermidine synthase [Myxococcota bacterium]